MGFYLNAEGRAGLDSYKYVSGSSTFIDRQMNKFWEWVITLLPLWIAPNLITLLGLGLNIFGCGLMLWYSPALGSLDVRWAHVLVVFRTQIRLCVYVRSYHGTVMQSLCEFPWLGV